MEIALKELKALISEAVDLKLQEAGIVSVDWEKMKLLSARGKLKGRWKIIMAAVEETGDPDKALNLLKSAVATMELHKNKSPEPAPALDTNDDPLDFHNL